MRNAELASLRTPNPELRTCDTPRAGTRGSVLLYVVWVVLLLSLFAAGVGSRALFALNLSRRLSEQLRAAYIARGAVRYAALVLARDGTPSFDGLNDSWSSGSLFREHPVDGGSFSVTGEPHTDGGAAAQFGLNDEERRINLNTAPTDVLVRFLEAAGGLGDDALAAAEAIEDWRDEDDDPRTSGAEGSYYRTLGDAYDCKNGPFENVEELLLVKGISPAVYRNVEPYVTVYGSGRLNLNTAPEAVLRSLGLSTAGLAGFLAFRAGEDSELGTLDDRALVAVSGLQSELAPYVPREDLARFAKLIQAQFLTTSSEAFRMSIQARTARPEGRMQVACVLDRKGNVQAWSER